MKKVFVSALCLAILASAMSCFDPILDFDGNFKSSNGNVTIRLAGADGRTIMPITPTFSSFELKLVNGDNIITPTNVSNVTGSGVTVDVSEGIWTITLKGYQTIDGNEVLAAQGSKELTVIAGNNNYSVEIELEPIAISESDGNGLFTFDIKLPTGLTSANLNIFGETFNLLTKTTGSKELEPGYYDMSIVLTKNGQSSGIFESVHIYSGLESPAKIDLSNIVFTDKVYLAGKLGGIRIGNIIIADNAGTELETFELNKNSVERSNSWLIEIPYEYIGQNIKVIQKFNGESSLADSFNLANNGKAGINLTLNPASAKYINLADWYSEKNGTELFFGFDVTVNFIKVNKSGVIENIILDNAITAQAFDANIYGGALAGFELYNAAVRGGLINAINAAQTECDAANVSVNGKEYKSTVKWVTSAEKAAYQNAINAANTVKNNPTLTEEQIANAEAALAAAFAAFENAKKAGTYKVDKSPLASAIINAEAKKANVAKSTDGSDVLNTDKWATPQAFTALNAAIAEAQAYVDSTDNNDDDQDVVNAKVAALNNAAAAFNTQNGLLIRTGIVFEYTVNMPKDENIVIPEVQAMSWVANDTFTLTAEGFDSYQWYVDGALKGSGNTFELKARDYSPTTHNLSLRVTKNGVSYSKTISFKVY